MRLLDLCDQQFCPICPAVYRHPRGKDPVRCGERLLIHWRDYHGTSCDLVFCEKCKRSFQVSYKVEVESIIQVSKE